MQATNHVGETPLSRGRSRREVLAGLAGLLVLGVSTFGGAGRARAAQTPEQARALLKLIDDRMGNAGDSTSTVYIQEKRRGQVDVIYVTTVYRRSREQKFMMLFHKPKSSRGQGYLRIDKNLWFYDPSIGRWERRTERERIGNTNSRRVDLDEWRLSEEYTPVDAGEERLGAYQAYKLKLTAKPGVDVAFPTLLLWVDEDSKNVLKRQEFSLSGKLLRTAYYPKWKKVYSASKRGDVWYPEEIRLFDEIEKSNQTIAVIKQVDTSSLPKGLFTKAWLESKS